VLLAEWFPLGGQQPYLVAPRQPRGSNPKLLDIPARRVGPQRSTRRAHGRTTLRKINISSLDREGRRNVNFSHLFTLFSRAWPAGHPAAPTTPGQSRQVGAGNELQSDGVWNFKYDPVGNLIEKDGLSNGLIWKYTWDDANHLLTATEYNASTGAVQEQETNFWDVFGNLIEQDQYNASTGTTTVLKLANQIVGLSSGQQGTGGTAPVWADLNGGNQIETRRLYLNAIDAVFARIGSGGSVAWYLSDHLGSIRGLMNNSGTLLDTIAYDAYGNITSESSPTSGDRFKFAGGQYDALTGLGLFGRRWYNPADGTWVSQDSLGLSPDSNPYRYVKNDPTTATDPSGLCGCPCMCGPYGPPPGFFGRSLLLIAFGLVPQTVQRVWRNPFF
jgi:RHS repeat-associated protein